MLLVEGNWQSRRPTVGEESGEESTFAAIRDGGERLFADFAGREMLQVALIFCHAAVASTQTTTTIQATVNVTPRRPA